MKNINWYKVNYKDWLGLSAAPVFWIASLICFILGLQFKTGTGIMIPYTDIDVVMLFSLGLGFANTALQIVGNDTEREDLGMPLFLMWMASYALGIGSNVNFLYSVIGINGWFLQLLVCGGLGIMIEVAPERLLVKFLRSAGILQPVKGSTQQPNSVKLNPEIKNHLPQSNGQRPQQRPNNNQRPQNNHSQRQVEPTYHPIQYMSSTPPTIDDLPEFLKNKRSGDNRNDN